MGQTITGTDGRLYLWQPNGTGGVNYFTIADFGDVNKLAPITREVFASQTGADVGMIEHQVANDYTAQNDVAIAEMPWSPTPQTIKTTGGTSAPSFQSYFGGQLYTDPAAYANAQRAYVEDIYNQNLATLGRTYGRAGEDVEYQTGQLQKQYGEQTTALQDALKRGLFNATMFYDRIAPSLYQSAETVSKAEKQKGFEKGQQQLAEEKARTERELERARSDIAYYRPLEEAQYAQKKQSTLDAIANQLLEDQGALAQRMSQTSAYNPEAYNIAYGNPNQSALMQAIGSTPTGGATTTPVAARTTGTEPQGIRDWLEQYYKYGF